MSAIREEVEDFLYRESALLDEWRLDEWLALLTEDARYRVPSNDAPSGDPADTLFLIADDIQRIRGRVARLKDPHAHAEFPHSRTRRLITNVRIVPGTNSGEFVPGTIFVEANFVVYRFRRGGQEAPTWAGIGMPCAASRASYASRCARRSSIPRNWAAWVR